MSSGLHTAYRVVRRVEEGTAGVSLILDGALAAEPGQFVMAWLPGVEERPLAVMDDDPLSLTVCDVGPFTCAMCALRPGDRVWVRGPFGHGFRPEGRRHLLVGGGSGTASLALLAKVAREHEGEVVAAVGARTAEGLMLAWRLREAGARVVLATDDGSAVCRGRSSRWRPFAERARRRLGCGPEPMLAASPSAPRPWASLLGEPRARHALRDRPVRVVPLRRAARLRRRAGLPRRGRLPVHEWWWGRGIRTGFTR